LTKEKLPQQSFGSKRCQVRPPSLVRKNPLRASGAEKLLMTGAKSQPCCRSTNVTWPTRSFTPPRWSNCVGADRRHVRPPFVVSHMPRLLIAHVTPPLVPIFMTWTRPAPRL
jgi:hypothetical protein